jgi:hypothetical protein
MGEAVRAAVEAGGSFSAWKRALTAVDPSTDAPWRAEAVPA